MSTLKSIPPVLPWQVYEDRDGDGTYELEGFAPTGTLTITTTPGGFLVNATFAAATGSRPTTFFWGDGTSTASVTNTGSHTYAAAGTYTVECSDGNRTGTAPVTVPGVLQQQKAEEPKRSHHKKKDE